VGIILDAVALFVVGSGWKDGAEIASALPECVK
jgi:hypothetical protein